MARATTALVRVMVAGLPLLLPPPLAAAPRLPSAFQLCRRSDPKFNECLKKAVGGALHTLADGSLELGTPPLDPLSIPKVVIPGNKNAPVNINLEFSNIVIRGAKNLQMKKVWTDLDHYRLSSEGMADNLLMESDYVMDGRILLIPANGKGRVVFNITQLNALANLTGEERAKKDAAYMKVTDFRFRFLELGHLSMKFDNLFNGDPALGGSVNTLLNENWQELWAELRGPFEQVLEPTFREFAKRCFDRAPYKEIFPP